MDTWNSRTIVGRRLKGAHLRALSGLTSSHTLRFAENAEPPPAATRVICAEEMVPTQREIPEFESFAM